MKTKEEAEERANHELKQRIKSHISQIRKDDIDGLVEWVEEEHKKEKNRIVGYEANFYYKKALSDIIAHLRSLKEKV
jgi:hypothetical protein